MNLFDLVKLVVLGDVLAAVAVIFIALMGTARAVLGRGWYKGKNIATLALVHTGHIFHRCFTKMLVKRKSGRTEKDRDSENDM